MQIGKLFLPAAAISALIITIAITDYIKVHVIPVSKSHNMTHVCIQNNPNVAIKYFANIIAKRFEKHRITTEIYSSGAPSHCQFTLKYAARQSRDFSLYLSNAKIEVYSNNQTIGHAEYHVRFNGGLSLMKWRSAEIKMAPILDQLLPGYQ